MENIGLQDSLLSRFDLLFIMLDQMDPEQDREISDHVLRMHRYRTPGEQDGDGETVRRVRERREPNLISLSEAQSTWWGVSELMSKMPFLAGPPPFLLTGGYPDICLLSISGPGNTFEHLLWARWFHFLTFGLRVSVTLGVFAL